MPGLQRFSVTVSPRIVARQVGGRSMLTGVGRARCAASDCGHGILGAVAGEDANRGAKRAREARKDLGLDAAAPLACVLDVVEQRVGLPVVVAALPDGLAGACVPLGTSRLLWVNGSQAPVRQRFTLAHELGHAWCGHDGHLEVDTVATISGATTSALEIQANAFAAEFLLPRAAIQNLLDRTRPSTSSS
jgi:Zn-dependent peptidase ImmA (M78 family)